MDYLAYAHLTEDNNFSKRSRACVTEQSNVFQNDGRPDIANLAKATLKGTRPDQLQTLLAGIAAGPGFADQANLGDGTIDSSKITDGEILSQTQAIYPQVAALYYDPQGNPI